jgi:hypothetical protein
MLRRAVLLAVGTLVAVGPAYASSASAPLTVTLTVVRSCVVQTGAERAGVTVRCTTSTGQVRVGESRPPAADSPTAPASPSTTPPVVSSPNARLVTINF